MPYTIEELRRIITPIAQAHGLRSVSLFGSYSKGTARRDSDVDLKIEKGSVMSLFQLSGLRLEICCFQTRAGIWRTANLAVWLLRPRGCDADKRH